MILKKVGLGALGSRFSYGCIYIFNSRDTDASVSTLAQKCWYAPWLKKAGNPDGRLKPVLKYSNVSILFVSNNFPLMLIFSLQLIQWRESIWSAVQTQQITASLCWQGLQMTHHACIFIFIIIFTFRYFMLWPFLLQFTATKTLLNS